MLIYFIDPFLEILISIYALHLLDILKSSWIMDSKKNPPRSPLPKTKMYATTVVVNFVLDISTKLIDNMYQQIQLVVNSTIKPVAALVSENIEDRRNASAICKFT